MDKCNDNYVGDSCTEIVHQQKFIYVDFLSLFQFITHPQVFIPIYNTRIF